MKSKISALGLALFAALAFGALSASAASAATDHITASEPWTPTGSPLTSGKFESTTGGGTGFSCNEGTATTTEAIPSTTDEAQVTASVSGCTAFEGGETKAAAYVENGGCALRITGETTAGNPTGGEHGNVIVERHEEIGPCHIEIKVTAFKFKCSSVPEQEIQHAGRMEQAEEGILVQVTAHGIESTTTNSIACPTETGGTEVHTNGSLVGEGILEGHNSAGKPVPLTLTKNAT
jgi:hypothetical protein